MPDRFGRAKRGKLDIGVFVFDTSSFFKYRKGSNFVESAMRYRARDDMVRRGSIALILFFTFLGGFFLSLALKVDSRPAIMGLVSMGIIWLIFYVRSKDKSKKDKSTHGKILPFKEKKKRLK